LSTSTLGFPKALNFYGRIFVVLQQLASCVRFYQ